MKKPKVSIIIVNYNGGIIFKNCLESVKKLNYSNYELVIVDNGSTDGTEKYANINNTKNTGFVGGNNQGVEIAKGKYILLLNNDTIIKPDLLDILVSRMDKDETLGVIQPKIFLMDKAGYLDNAGSFFTKIGFLDHWGFNKKDSGEYNNEKEIFSAKGACMMIRKELIDKIGLFDKDYFAYFEESDFCWRVWLSGYKIIYYPKTSIRHKVGFTTKSQNVNFLNYLYYRNRICSLIKNLEFKNLIWIFPLHLVLSFGIAFIFLIRGSMSSFLLIMRAIKWNFVYLENTLKKRSKVQKIRQISDEVIFSSVGRKVDLGKFFNDFKRVEKDLT
jgi:GT2 family glycosyltransferase